MFDVAPTFQMHHELLVVHATVRTVLTGGEVSFIRLLSKLANESSNVKNTSVKRGAISKLNCPLPTIYSESQISGSKKRYFLYETYSLVSEQRQATQEERHPNSISCQLYAFITSPMNTVLSIIDAS